MKKPQQSIFHIYGGYIHICEMYPQHDNITYDHLTFNPIQLALGCPRSNMKIWVGSLGFLVGCESSTEIWQTWHVMKY